MADTPEENSAQDPYVVRFRFKMEQDVKIVPLKLIGRVMGRSERSPGLHDYRVIYWADSKRHDEWLYDHELDDA